MPKISRRSFIQNVTAVSIAGCAKSTDKNQPPDTREPIEPITPADTFYITSYAPPPDEEWIDNWSLHITGLDGDDLILTLGDLQSLASEEIEHTLECISNASFYAISNGTWRGVRFQDLLNHFEASHSQSHINMYCGEGYSTSLPASVIDDGMALVWTLNGEPLTVPHGKPVRMLVPGRFGMKNPKWIERIELTEEPELGFWESRGWSNSAHYLLHSWIHAPTRGDKVSQGGADLIGSAFFGSEGIAKVEISDDEGETWNECEITYAGGPNVWTLWRYRWVPAFVGMYTLMVRATAPDGTVQEDGPAADSELDGYEALHRIQVFVE
ncbi:MAG: molybdopterin-dependent oxidoreductase [Myxococcota bacterium]|nr:molybdopterin-dependent oxidoreductase [Myxococcota bacterium]